MVLVALPLLPLSRVNADEVPQANLGEYHKSVEPALRATCIGCHGPEKQKGNFRIDTLDADLLQGGDVVRSN